MIEVELSADGVCRLYETQGGSRTNATTASPTNSHCIHPAINQSGGSLDGGSWPLQTYRPAWSAFPRSEKVSRFSAGCVSLDSGGFGT